MAVNSLLQLLFSIDYTCHVGSLWIGRILLLGKHSQLPGLLQIAGVQSDHRPT